MGDSIFVNVLKQIDHLCDIEYFDVFVEFVNICFDEADELSSFAVLEYEIKALLILK
jgi:hypothetical protein